MPSHLWPCRRTFATIFPVRSHISQCSLLTVVFLHRLTSEAQWMAPRMTKLEKHSLDMYIYCILHCFFFIKVVPALESLTRLKRQGGASVFPPPAQASLSTRQKARSARLRPGIKKACPALLILSVATIVVISGCYSHIIVELVS